MKRIFLVVAMITVLFAMPNSVNAQDRFVWIFSNDITTFSLDSQTIVYKDNIIDCWIRYDFTQEAIKQNINNYKEKKDYLLAEKYSKCAWSLVHYQFDLNKPYHSNVVATHMYDKNGKSIYSMKFTPNWIDNVPNTLEETLLLASYSYALSNGKREY